MKLRRRLVTVAPDVAEYIEALKPLYPKLGTLWAGVLWTLEHRADQIGEPLAGSSHMATVKLSAQLPIVTIVFKLSEETVHVTDCDFRYVEGEAE